MADDGAREGKLTHDAADALARLQAESACACRADQAPGRRASGPGRGWPKMPNGRSAKAKSRLLKPPPSRPAPMPNCALPMPRWRMHARGRSGRRAMRRGWRKNRMRLGDESELTDGKTAAQNAWPNCRRSWQQALESIETAEALRDKLDRRARRRTKSRLPAPKPKSAALLSEQAALERALAKGSGDKAIDRIKVEPGYERALAAALGDDANAGIGGDRRAALARRDCSRSSDVGHSPHRPCRCARRTALHGCRWCAWSMSIMARRLLPANGWSHAMAKCAGGTASPPMMTARPPQSN